jgi:hypothetical protein
MLLKRPVTFFFRKSLKVSALCEVIDKGEAMETSFVGRNVDLSLLGEWVERFFKNKEFKVAINKKAVGYTVTAGPTYVHEIVGNINVSVYGEPNDFVVRFIAGARSGLYKKFGLLTSLFGGGVLLMRGMKSEEAEEKVEKDFWVYVEEKIDFLADSAGKI